MAWTKATDLMPQENEQILIHDNRNNRMETGRYIGGKWYVENLQTGELSEIACVTHWAVMLESYLNDDSDDD
jgi:hypothetical protein